LALLAVFFQWARCLFTPMTWPINLHALG
jgi:hypothetical protein